ncbi:energy transducer TonB [Sphingomonas donggukensis]|uniref:Energy transducer TonB n=1 Tax=Sphingomonas donggukensis TaxID=2949093 RepID=A0ABY4TVJ3_9SPHN|nr:energy transducer TonB [Sphingomonas donggukensis]URW76312.1 energy transducer TonB [Sphingomonas donggukensis]
MLLLALALQVATNLPTAVPDGDASNWLTQDDYPPSAIKAGAEGTVAVRLTVGTDGRPVACDVTSSSGTEELDRAACTAIVTRGRFKPAKTQTSYTRRVLWRMPDMAAPIEITTAKFPDSVTEFEVTSDAEGRIEACRVVVRPSPDFDPCAQAPIGQKVDGGHVRNGKPVRAVRTMRSSTTTRFID